VLCHNILNIIVPRFHFAGNICKGHRNLIYAACRVVVGGGGGGGGGALL
jgi:hypothetical protein